MSNIHDDLTPSGLKKGYSGKKKKACHFFIFESRTGGGCALVMRGHSRTTIDPHIPTMPRDGARRVFRRPGRLGTGGGEGRGV